METKELNLKEFIENETGQKFNKQLKINSPFSSKDKTPSFSIYYDDNSDKWKFKDFSTGAVGDIIDFCMQYKDLNYMQAREYLGLSKEKTKSELELEKVESYINWSLENQEFRRGYELLGIFKFCDENNETVYFKAKFKKPNGSKELSYFSIYEDGKVSNKRNYEFELPYNLYNTIIGLSNGKILILVEGERDVNRLNSIINHNKYVVASIKNCREQGIDLLKVKDMKVYSIPDNDEPGEKYFELIKNSFLNQSSSFKRINLRGIKSLGKGTDVTDWLEAGHTKKDLLTAFERSLDLKDRYELQQDKGGIYRSWPSKTNPDEYRKQYLTDFQVIEAKRLRFIEEDREGVRLLLKSNTGELIERIGPSSKFDDVKSFKNFLGTMDLAFKGKPDDLTDLKTWINKYWALENQEIYTGDKFIFKDDKLTLVTGDGAIGSSGINNELVSDSSNINIINKELINKDELKELKNHIFKFAETSKAISIIGTLINDLATYQNKEVGEKLHILLIVGESQSGKSTILEKIIMPILNYNSNQKKSISGTSQAAFMTDLSNGNYPSVYDEFKPSMMDNYKMAKLSNLFRDLYDRQVINKGDKTFKIRNFNIERSLIMAGEENYPNSETALITRSCIVYLSRNERTEKNSKAMEWIIANQDILNKFGRSIIEEILNISVDQYKDIRDSKKEAFKELKERTLSTAINISCGIEIFNVLLERHGLKKIEDYEKYIFQNIKEEILENESDTKSTVENMLVLYNNMIEDGRAFYVENVIRNRPDGLFIRTSEMINEIFKFIKDYGSAEVIPLKLKDFKKQAAKAGYLLKQSGKVIKINEKNVRFDEYDKEKFKALRLDSIVEPDLMEMPMSRREQKVIENVFPGV